MSFKISFRQSFISLSTRTLLAPPRGLSAIRPPRIYLATILLAVDLFLSVQAKYDFSLKMSECAFVCQLTLLNIDTYSNILIESSINTNEMYSRINEKRIYVIDITFSINESTIFSGNEQQKVYY